MLQEVLDQVINEILAGNKIDVASCREPDVFAIHKALDSKLREQLTDSERALVLEEKERLKNLIIGFEETKEIAIEGKPKTVPSIAAPTVPE